MMSEKLKNEFFEVALTIISANSYANILLSVTVSEMCIYQKRILHIQEKTQYSREKKIPTVNIKK